MNLDRWQEFVAFSRYMNMSAAAGALNISESTLSKHIAALEDELGVAVLFREKPLRLTSAGRALVKGAPKVIQSYSTLVDTVRLAADVPSEVIIAGTSTFSAPKTNLSIFLNCFTEIHPDISCVLRDSTASTAVEALRLTGADCVAAFVHPLREDLRCGLTFERIPLFAGGHLGLWVDSSSALAAKESAHWTDLAGAKVPFPSNAEPMITAALKQLVAEHCPQARFVDITESHDNYLADLRTGDIQILDEQLSRIPSIEYMTRRVWIPLDEPEAVSNCYLAYRRSNVSQALGVLLDYLHGMEQFNAEEDIISG